MKSVQFSVAILSQLEEVVEQLTDEAYRNTMEVFSGASIGQHIRHILEFYSCILEQHATGEICYDTRKRDLQLEESRMVALSFIEFLSRELHCLEDDKNLILSSTLHEVVLKTPSSLSREMLYALEHAVHHMAIVKIGLLVSCPQLQIPTNFGVADSTVQYRSQCVQ